VLLASATLLLIGLAWWTIAGGVRNLPQSNTVGRQVETAVQLACGLLSVLVVVTRFRWRRWGAPVRTAWAIALAASAALSALVWGPPQPTIAILFAAVALLVAWAIIRALGTSAT
jgi:hypothetical protein